MSSTSYQAKPLGPRLSGSTCLVPKLYSRELTLEGTPKEVQDSLQRKREIAEALVSGAPRK